MTYPGVYLIRIFDRTWGFRVVAVVAMDEAQAREICVEKYKAQFEARGKRMFAEIMDACDTQHIGSTATMEFSE